MPWLKALPTWLAINNCNFVTESALTDAYTGQPYTGGALNKGDYTDLDDQTAAASSYTTNGLLYAGRYRCVQVDSGATAANVKTGTVGYVRAGSQVVRAVITNAGSGGTAGTYQVAATAGSGGGSGAVLTVVVGSGGTITSVTVSNTGFGYVSAPSFNVATPTSASGATVVAQLNLDVNVVTSADVALGANAALAGVGPVRPVVFLNSITPGNFGFVQELGTATVIATASQTQAASQFAIVKSSSADGTMTASSATSSIYVIGNVVDPLTTPPAGTPFKIVLGPYLPTVQG